MVDPHYDPEWDAIVEDRAKALFLFENPTLSEQFWHEHQCTREHLKKRVSVALEPFQDLLTAAVNARAVFLSHAATDEALEGGDRRHHRDWVETLHLAILGVSAA